MQNEREDRERPQARRQHQLSSRRLWRILRRLEMHVDELSKAGDLDAGKVQRLVQLTKAAGELHTRLAKSDRERLDLEQQSTAAIKGVIIVSPKKTHEEWKDSVKKAVPAEYEEITSGECRGN